MNPATGGHDNSAKNPNNPDPTKLVKLALQSWDEMRLGFMAAAGALPRNGREAAPALTREKLIP